MPPSLTSLEPDHNDPYPADLAQIHPWDRLVVGVAQAQSSGARSTWLAGLAATSAPAATPESVAAGWLAAQPGYARAKGYITADQFARRTVESLAVTADSPVAADARWLALLATLPGPQRAAIVQAPAKQQLYWYLLPLVTALADNRALDLSLARVNAPTWGRPPNDLAPGDLNWFSAAEGLVDGSGTIALLETDPYLCRGLATDDGTIDAESDNRVVVVRDKTELFDFVYATAFAGYVEPVVAQYQELLTAHGISSSRRALYASGLFGLVYPPYAQYQA
ncbi:MAG: hypothetical protein ACRDPW_01215, partial [Mycobacteriales bacterium]